MWCFTGIGCQSLAQTPTEGPGLCIYDHRWRRSPDVPLAIVKLVTSGASLPVLTTTVSPWGDIDILTVLLTYLLTPWSRVLLEKLTGSQLVKKFPGIYGIRRFITAFTSARHLSLSWDRSNQSIPLHPTYWRSVLILSSHQRLEIGRAHVW
jgi:hypothetical protein